MFNISTQAFLIQTFESGDLDSVVSLLQQTLPQENITPSSFARKVLLDANFDPTGALVAIDRRGHLCGFLLALVRRRPLDDGPDDSQRGWITLFAVAEGARRQGIGNALLKAGEDWLREHGRTEVWISPYAPNYWTPGVDEAAYPDALAFLLRRGYKVAYRPLSMAVSLQSENISVRAAQCLARAEAYGLELLPFAPAHILPLTAFLRKEFPGDWQRYVRETMQDILLERRDPTDLWTGWQQENIVGFAQNEGERFGPFGVAAAARGKGFGAALLYQVLAEMQRSGKERAWFMWTDDTTAARVYSPAGFRETRRYAVLKKSL